MPSLSAAGRRESGGRITARLEETEGVPPPGADRLMIATTVHASPGAEGPWSEADLIAQSKAQQEAAERIAALERTIGLLQKLIETREAVAQGASSPASPSRLALPGQPPSPAPGRRSQESLMDSLQPLWLALLLVVGLGAFGAFRWQRLRRPFSAGASHASSSPSAAGPLNS